MRVRALGWAAALLISAWAANGQATAKPATVPTAPPAGPATGDLSWLKGFAAGAGAGRDVKWDPRFRALIERALTQRQWFIKDHGRFLPIFDTVQLFIGIPGQVHVDEGRYVTAEGCMPHACGARGMVWVDTQTGAVIFVAPEDVSGQPIRTTQRDVLVTRQHLWLFASKGIWEDTLPAAFKVSLQRWLENGPEAQAFPYRVALATIVQTNGVPRDAMPDVVLPAGAGAGSAAGSDGGLGH